MKLTADDSIESVISKINSDSDVTVFFDQQSQRFSITAKNTGELTNGNPEIELSSTGDFFQQLKMELDSDKAANSGCQR